MCGIGGIFNLDHQAVDKRKLEEMTSIISHRGPDDEGYLLVNTQEGNFLHCHGKDSIPEVKSTTPSLGNDFGADLAFGFRRLSILDLSPLGHQPMTNEDQSIWLVFNGEVYNYLELREELKTLGYSFYSGADTEVVIKAYQEWGTECLARFNGMWSFALWDNTKRRLFCARDRFGVKPFNYFFDGTRFIFGSEVKQLLVHPVDRSVNPGVIFKSFSIAGFLQNSDTTYFDKIKILPHSHFIMIENGNFRLSRYYDLDPSTFEKSRESFHEAGEHYRELFTNAVRLRMRSDVEVGSTLSGGLDSSAIVSIAAGYTPKQFKTFTSFYTQDQKYDERKWAELVVAKTGSLSHFISARPEQVLQDISDITWHHDYPVTGSSPVAQYYVMKLAHENGAIVLLDGQGSDEISGGYAHTFYRYYADMLAKGRFVKFFSEFPDYLKHVDKGSPLAKSLKTMLVLLFPETRLYRNEARMAFNPLSIKYDSSVKYDEILDIRGISRVSNFLYNQLMAISIQSLLHYEDRNSMAHSIESRVPFLDYRFVEYVFSLPSSFKLHKNLGKYIHREALKSIVPPEIMERRDKLGFLAPGENYWLRNEFRPFYTEMMDSRSFRDRGIFDHKLISAEYQNYLKGDNTHAWRLWMVMALEIWFRRFVD